jgi:hypothetical protein
MKNITVEEWALALESGKYEQGTGCLKRDNHYCCLGVLCDLIDNTKWNITTRNHFIYNETSDASLPSNIKLVPSGHDHYYIQSELINMNDVAEKTFKEIAQYIRENIKEIKVSDVKS